MALSPALQKMVKDARNRMSRSTSKMVSIKEGKTKVRILQASPDAKFWQEYGVHWIKTELKGKPVAVVGCRDAVYDEPCPICTAIEKTIESAVDDDTIALAKEWKARKRVLVNALIRSGTDASEDPVVLDLTTTTFDQILAIMEEFGTEGANVFDLDEGIDLIIERKGKGFDTEYNVMQAAKSAPVPKGTLAKMHDLLAFVEKEFFKGEETKALRAIAGVSGLSLAAPATKPLLTSATVDEDALETMAARSKPKTVAVDDDVPFDINDEPAPPRKAAPAGSKPKADKDFGAPIEEEELDTLLSELDGIIAD